MVIEPPAFALAIVEAKSHGPDHGPPRPPPRPPPHPPPRVPPAFRRLGDPGLAPGLRRKGHRDGIGGYGRGDNGLRAPFGERKATLILERLDPAVNREGVGVCGRRRPERRRMCKTTAADHAARRG